MSFKNLFMHKKKLTFCIFKNFKFLPVIYINWVKIVLTLKQIELS